MEMDEVMAVDESDPPGVTTRTAEPEVREPARPAAAHDHVCGCASSGGPSSGSFVYAIGRIEARFPNLAVEKEFAQSTGHADTAGLTDQQVFRDVLAAPGNRYMAREVCWVLTVQGIDTYILSPRDPRDFDLLVESVRPEPDPLDLDVVIGTRGRLAPPEVCNGLVVPVVAVDQVYSFDRDSLLRAIPKSASMSDEQHQAAARQVLSMILQLADNAGATDEHRALNYLAMRYPDIYTRTGEQFAADHSLSGIEVRSSTLSTYRRVMNCIFTYTHRTTAFTEKSVVSVDVTEKFPFLVGKLSTYLDRVGRVGAP